MRSRISSLLAAFVFAAYGAYWGLLVESPADTFPPALAIILLALCYLMEIHAGILNERKLLLTIELLGRRPRRSEPSSESEEAP